METAQATNREPSLENTIGVHGVMQPTTEMKVYTVLTRGIDKNLVQKVIKQ